MAVEETPPVEEIHGADAPPTRRQVRGLKTWMKLTAREHAESKQSDTNDAAKAAAAAIARMFERRKFG